MNMEKYLPIGSVCKIKNNNLQYIIIGYNSQSYEDKMYTYDYIAGVYPEGLTSFNKLHVFNHEDIVTVDFVGYKDFNYEKLNKLLLCDTGSKESNLLPEVDYVFDENGTVLSDGKEILDKYITKNDVKISDNPFQDTNEQIVAEHSKTDSKEWPIFNKIKFDENGVVVSDGTEEIKEVENNKFVFDENGVLISDGTEILQPSGSNFVFDENGVVVSDGKTKLSKTEPVVETKYKFDKNGVVIADGSAVEVKESNFKFDENGIVISDGTKVEETSQLPEYKFDENGILVSDGINKLDYVSPKLVSEPKPEEKSNDLVSGFKFDENGVVIGEPDFEEKEDNYIFDENGVVVADYSSQNKSTSNTDGNVVIDESQY